MRTASEIADLIEQLVNAKVDGDSRRLVMLVDGLVRSPRGDVMNVAVLLAGILAEELRDVEPERGYHTVIVSHLGSDGVEVRDSVQSLPPQVACYAQMVTAIANGDAPMARDLFLGFCGDDWQRAVYLIVYALDQVVHANLECESGGGNTVLEGAVE